MTSPFWTIIRRERQTAWLMRQYIQLREMDENVREETDVELIDVVGLKPDEESRGVRKEAND